MRQDLANDRNLMLTAHIVLYWLRQEQDTFQLMPSVKGKDIQARGEEE
jgi:hypothetical protein